MYRLPGRARESAELSGPRLGAAFFYLFLYEQYHGNECILTDGADQNWDFLKALEKRKELMRQDNNVRGK